LERVEDLIGYKNLSQLCVVSITKIRPGGYFVKFWKKKYGNKTSRIKGCLNFYVMAVRKQKSKAVEKRSAELNEWSLVIENLLLSLVHTISMPLNLTNLLEMCTHEAYHQTN
jgi:hypothetical protein